jgi:hypothetical protein
MRTTRICPAEADPTEINTAPTTNPSLRNIPRNMTPPLMFALFGPTFVFLREPCRL